QGARGGGVVGQVGPRHAPPAAAALGGALAPGLVAQGGAHDPGHARVQVGGVGDAVEGVALKEAGGGLLDQGRRLRAGGARRGAEPLGEAAQVVVQGGDQVGAGAAGGRGGGGGRTAVGGGGCAGPAAGGEWQGRGGGG